MNILSLPSFAVLSSILLIVPPSGYGGWLQCGGWLGAETGHAAATAATPACCKAMVDAEPESETPATGCHASAVSSASDHAPCHSGQGICDCCDATEATVPARTVPPAPTALFVVMPMVDLDLDRSGATDQPAVVPGGSRFRLHLLNCVWLC